MSLRWECQGWGGGIFFFLVPLTSLRLSHTNLPQKVHCPEMFIEIIEQVLLLLDTNSKSLTNSSEEQWAYCTQYH